MLARIDLLSNEKVQWWFVYIYISTLSLTELNESINGNQNCSRRDHPQLLSFILCFPDPHGIPNHLSIVVADIYVAIYFVDDFINKCIATSQKPHIWFLKVIFELLSSYSFSVGRQGLWRVRAWVSRIVRIQHPAMKLVLKFWSGESMNAWEVTFLPRGTSAPGMVASLCLSDLVWRWCESKSVRSRLSRGFNCWCSVSTSMLHKN